MADSKKKWSLPEIKNPLSLLGAILLIVDAAFGLVGLKVFTGTERFQVLCMSFGILALLVLLMFATLWLRPQAFYGPRDFRDEENYVAALNLRPFPGTPTHQTLRPESVGVPAPSQVLTARAEEKTPTTHVAGIGASALVVDVVADAAKYFGLRQLNLTDVSNPSAYAIYLLGMVQQFLLWDGPSGIVFFGGFHEHEERDVNARAVCLLKNLDLAYSRTDELPEENKQSNQRVLDLISIELVVKSDEIAKRVTETAQRFLPKRRQVEFLVHTPGSLHQRLEQLLVKLGI